MEGKARQVLPVFFAMISGEGRSLEMALLHDGRVGCNSKHKDVMVRTGLRDGPALVLVACRQGHVALVVKPMKTTQKVAEQVRQNG